MPRHLAAAAPLVLLLSAPVALRAQPRWQEIGRTATGSPVELDRRSVKAANGITTATLRVRLVKPMRSNKGPITGSKTTAMFDCAKREYAVKENTYYLDEKTNRVYEHKVISQPGFSTVLGGSMPAVAIAHFCAK